MQSEYVWAGASVNGVRVGASGACASANEVCVDTCE